jgi:hypothetical protein
MVQTLQHTMASLETELELLSKAEAIDQRSLQSDRRGVWQLFGQADDLLEMMLQRDAEMELLSTASDLVTYFDDTASALER